MSILFEAWRRARGDDSRLAETLGAPPPAGGRRRSVLLPWVLAFVLAAVAAGLGVYLWRIERAPAPRQATPAAARNEPVATRSITPVLPAPVSTPTVVQVQAGTSADHDTVALPGVATPLRSATRTSRSSAVAAAAPAYVATSVPASGATQTPSATAVQPRTGVAAAAGEPASAAAGAAVPDDVRAALPTLDVMIHVWNTDPDRRFVVINGHIFRAGDEVAVGVKLVDITRDGEVVSFRGYRIELPGS